MNMQKARLLVSLVFSLTMHRACGHSSFSRFSAFAAPLLRSRSLWNLVKPRIRLRRLQAASGGESWIMSWEKEQEERKETTKRQQTRWKQTRGNRREVNMSSSSGSSNSNTGDQKGQWRQCAGAIIFNKHMEVLIGRRKEKGNYWQFPQGGIEAGEHPAESAIREVYEEMGIRSPGDVELVTTLDVVQNYLTPTGSWLHQQGYVGQRMHWTLFYYTGPHRMPKVDVSGLGGEKQEFASVAWTTWEKLLPRTVWFKRDMYVSLQSLVSPLIHEYTSKQSL